MTFRDPTAWMWDEALELLYRAEGLQRRFFRLQQVEVCRSCPSWEPPVDICELGDELIILVALPGVPAEQVEVFMDGAVLIIRGERPLPAVYRNGLIHRIEMPHGFFERRIDLSPGRFRIRQQSLDAGCLGVTLGRLPRSD
jgi:HSP20 family protein